MHYNDKNGDPFEIKIGEEGDIDRLMAMYAQFEPRGHYQGIPPLNLQTCLSWVGHLFKTGENFLALRNGRVIGHAALLPDFTLRDAEYLVFLHQHHRGYGIGTALTRHALARAQHLGLMTIWLTVKPDNFIAVRLYRKCGFSFCGGTCFEEERKMALSLAEDDAAP